MYQVQVYELKTEDPFVVLAFSVFPTGSWLILASFSLPARRRNRKNNLFLSYFSYLTHQQTPTRYVHIMETAINMDTQTRRHASTEHAQSSTAPVDNVLYILL